MPRAGPAACPRPKSQPSLSLPNRDPGLYKKNTLAFLILPFRGPSQVHQAMIRTRAVTKKTVPSPTWLLIFRSPPPSPAWASFSETFSMYEKGLALA